MPAGLPSAIRTAGALVAESGTRLSDDRVKRRPGGQQDRAPHASGPCCVATRQHRRLSDYLGRLCAPGKNTGVRCQFLLQGMFLTQGRNLHLLCISYFAGGFSTTDPLGEPHCATREPQRPRQPRQC